MDIIPTAIQFQVLICLWDDPRTEGKYSKPIRRLRSIYRYSAVALHFYMTLLLTINIFVSWNDVDSLTRSLFLTMSYILDCVSLLSYFQVKNRFMVVLNILRSDICLPRNLEEREATEFPKFLRLWLVTLLYIAYLSVILPVVTPILQPLEQRGLPLHTYRFYDLSNFTIYVLTYIQHVISYIQAAGYSIFFSVSIFEVLAALTRQFRLVSCRFRRCVKTKDRRLLIQSVRHHILLQKLTHEVNDIFNSVITTYICFSFIIVCTATYQITKVLRFQPRSSKRCRKGSSGEPSGQFMALVGLLQILSRIVGLEDIPGIFPNFYDTVCFLLCFSSNYFERSAEFIFLMHQSQNRSGFQIIYLVSYLSSILCQAFNLCFVGEELRHASAILPEVIYNTDWTEVSPKWRKDLLIVMANGRKDLMISSHGIAPLTLVTFKWMVNMSYSMYSLLRSV